MFVNSPSHRAQQSLDVVYTVTIFVRCCWLLLGLENRRRNFQRSFKGSATDRNSTTPCFSESSSKKRKRETNNDSKLSSIFHDCNCERNCVSETWVKPKPKHDLRLLANFIGWENNASSLIGRAILKSQSERRTKTKTKPIPQLLSTVKWKPLYGNMGIQFAFLYSFFILADKKVHKGVVDCST